MFVPLCLFVVNYLCVLLLLVIVLVAFVLFVSLWSLCSFRCVCFLCLCLSMWFVLSCLVPLVRFVCVGYIFFSPCVYVADGCCSCLLMLLCFCFFCFVLRVLFG